MHYTCSILSLCLIGIVNAASFVRRASPSVSIPFGTIVGSKGIPYAQPPLNVLRLKPPKPLASPLGVVVATDTPRSCPQFMHQAETNSLLDEVISSLGYNPLMPTTTNRTITNAGEDCLTINVQRPSSANATSKLPVLFWIYGGGFEFGSTGSIYDGTEIILKSEAQGRPVIFVAVNYRLGGFGFVPGKEVLADGAANLGLLDHRLGLEWVADNIAAFGGDPTKVTIWGESAGAISVLDQMVLYSGDNTYKKKPLFRAAIMNSGSILPANPINSTKAQGIYDTVVSHAGCASSAVTLACLRSVDYETLLNAANSVPSLFSYNGNALSYLPRPDGVVLAGSPEVLVQSGKFARVPFIIGDQEDEGTLFSLFQSNLTTTDKLINYYDTIWYPSAPRTSIAELVTTYPEDPSAGSPFRTGTDNELYPQYKRIATLSGNLTFNLLRRAFLTMCRVLPADVVVSQFVWLRDPAARHISWE